MSRGPVRLGVIGLGAMGRTVLAEAVAHPAYSVRHVADVDAAALARVATEHPDLRVSTDPRTVLADEQLTAVYLATPPATHAELAVAALSRGLAVLCEKPLAVDLGDGRRMAEAAAGAPVPAAVNFSLSDRAAVLRVERAVRAGQVGELVAVDLRCSFPEWPRAFQRDAGWLAEPAQGGFVREVLSHFLYLTDRVVGRLAVDHAALSFGDGPRYAETSAGALLHAGSVPVRVGAQVAAGPETYEWVLWGSRRSFRLTAWTELETSDGGPWRPVRLTGEAGSLSSRLSRFAELVATGERRDLASFADALRVQEAVEAVHHLAAWSCRARAS